MTNLPWIPNRRAAHFPSQSIHEREIYIYIFLRGGHGINGGWLSSWADGDKRRDISLNGLFPAIGEKAEPNEEKRALFSSSF